jgi:hypothetical protein
MKILHLIILLLVLSCTFTCHDEAAKAGDVSINQIIFTNNGPNIPDPVRTIVVFSPDSIDYSQLQSGNILKLWHKEIEPTDFDSIEQIINEYTLCKSEDVVLPYSLDKIESVPPLLLRARVGCLASGWRGMEITIEAEYLKHSFKIYGSVCHEDWPIGVQILVTRRDELIKKYQQ